ncbi:DNA replication factor Cdt1 isoform X1 [Anopheles funestus]|uniref:DNA replication factor Cdt1 isoform X1 n=1 Tax=Anopheles funestus TaxID=62324 RepID=UPI0020C657BC|nr:DNA replication factor Cdt1 isoform X1 [Anopheles funestus]
MSQPTVASYFNTRKRAAHDALLGAGKNKVLILENSIAHTNGNLTNSSLNSDHEELRFVHANDNNFTLKNIETAGKDNGGGTRANPDPTEMERRVTRASRAIKRIGPVDLDEKTKALLSSAQPKLVSFIKKGNLSPQKRVHTASPSKQPVVPEKKLASPKKIDNGGVAGSAPASVEFSPRNSLNNVAKAPTKATVTRTLQLGKDKDSMSLADIRNKLLQHPRLPELKTKLNNIQSGLDRVDRLRKERLEGKKPAVSPIVAAKNLQQFSTLDVEVMVSPKKTIISPSKLLRTPTKDASNSLSPSKNVTPKRISALMSPIKDPSIGTPITASPKKLPAYQRFHNLVESGTPTLHLPFKYRSLLELFKCTDTVCSMFHNRKEQITFKKLKPAVQRMARKNFFESHLAQIQFLFPKAFSLSQEMTKNYGSATKHETYQLVIRPNIEEDVEQAKKSQETDFLRTIPKQSVNPQALLERYQHFRRLLLEKTKDAHETFLLSLDPPLNIERNKIVRWHADFDLEGCPDIEKAELPQPPNVEKFSSAKDVLSTARNLFSCGTAMERALARLEQKKKQDTAATVTSQTPLTATEDTKPVEVKEENSSDSNATSVPASISKDPAEHLLRNVPKALLEKIRAKQAAKALDQMTRRPSQEKEAMKYSRLPEIARHLRNVFVTERKNVLPLETPVVKIENSYRGKLTLQELEDHIRMIAQLVPFWLTLPEVRKVKYAKIAKDCDMSKVLGVLERKANEVVQ